ncbi:MarR family winged helix-turn-helix transcriptional regulator [Longimicrobium terrae]|uniref:DNA-binding MarR family transcriptional regulator n=1 Tax=Longimicrobium terrae TaxID=1639882 RepID=A0A841H441_9BACT|nr:MarR family winged helix-turn-helix transcriptional regulator [Longimicrobium terrae]MBB4638598.1 DNA-binding MarR family transcriptional regulator [Longimicrobium terrae]MBB6072764.1 DNA-binding MarR family transcriptional regulator [Longimicrobium terrae]NNC30618.1 winged helix-turn-helix transcriptional regulator [Longimicrobium terrae]
MSEHTENGAAFTALVLEVFRVNRLLQDAGDQLSAPAGLSTARWQVLGVVEHGPIPVADVARAMGLTRQSVRETAALLEAEGFVEFVENPRHRRARLMRITHLGLAAMERLAAGQAAWANRLAEALPLEALRATVRTMGRIRESLEPDSPLAESGS